MLISDLKIKKEKKDIQNLYKILSSENLNFDRAKCSFYANEDFLYIKMKAKDTIAMKTVLNTLLKIIETYEKAK